MPEPVPIPRRFKLGGVIFDGGMGSMLIAQGLGTGEAPEGWNVTRPDDILAIHQAYLDAGAHVITTNTFGSTPTRMKRHGLSERLTEINQAGVELARRAIDAYVSGKTAPAKPTPEGSAARLGPPLVALSIGPTGLMLPPVGKATEAEITNEFEAQLEDVRGFDLILIETMFDLREALAALRVARERRGVFVAVSLTYNKTPRGFFTMMGDEVSASVRRLDEVGCDAVGANCSITSGEMLELALPLRGATALPVVCQPNAGQPRLDGETHVYPQTADEFAADASRLFDIGVNVVGGCCGTTPDFIRALRELRREDFSS